MEGRRDGWGQMGEERGGEFYLRSSEEVRRQRAQRRWGGEIQCRTREESSEESGANERL